MPQDYLSITFFIAGDREWNSIQKFTKQINLQNAVKVYFKTQAHANESS